MHPNANGNGIISNLSGHSNLQYVNIDCRQANGFPEASSVPELRELIYKGTADQELPLIAELPNLEILSLTGFSSISEFPNPDAENLRVMKLQDMIIDVAIPDMQYDSLRVLSFFSSDYHSVYIPDFQSIPQLEELDLSYMHTYPEGVIVPNFSNLPQLNDLELCPGRFWGVLPTFENSPLIDADDLEDDCFNKVAIGKVFYDENFSCTYEEDENGLSNQLVLMDDEFLTVTNSSGHYQFSADTGWHNFKVFTSQELWENNCASNEFDVYIDTLMGFVSDANFPFQPTANCTVLEVNTHLGFVRPCLPSDIYVSYLNQGSIVAENAYVSIDLGVDLTLTDCSLPYFFDDDGNLIVELENLEPFDSGSFKVYLEASCDLDLSDHVCIDSYILPIDYCSQQYPDWEGELFQVSGQCQGTDLASFEIVNIGEDMDVALDYVVESNGVELSSGTFQLEAEETWNSEIPFESGSVRLIIITDENSPQENISRFVTACDLSASENSPLDFAAGDLDLFHDHECRQVTGSFDPNDIQVFPGGTGETNCIEIEQDLEYLIRFQNTGTDTAFNVSVYNEISENLDLLSLEIIDVSHNMDLEISDRELRFRFDDIYLPDSNVNLLGSNGFIKYRIRQNQENVIGDVIDNEADIYFDFNAPIKTNTAFNTIGDCYYQEPDSTLSAIDVSILNLLSPLISGQEEGVGDITIELLNNGPEDLTELLINWSINGDEQIPYYLENIELAAGDTYILNIGAYLFEAGTSYELTIWAEDPNGSTDTNVNNDFYYATIDGVVEVEESCVEIFFMEEVLCSGNDQSYTLLLTPMEDYSETYSIVNLNTGDSETVSGSSIILGPFENTSSYVFEITVPDEPDCSYIAEASMIDCVSTAIELIDFEGMNQLVNNLISWRVASEFETAAYIIEHSSNGIDFEFLFEFKASGFSNTELSYDCIHERPQASLNYYRLSEKTTDGKVTIVSKVIAIDNSDNSEHFDLGVSVFPNPANEHLTIELTRSEQNARNSELIELIIYDLQGRILRQKSLNMESKTQQLHWNIEDLAPGIYHLHVLRSGSQNSVRFIKE